MQVTLCRRAENPPLVAKNPRLICVSDALTGRPPGIPPTNRPPVGASELVPEGTHVKICAAVCGFLFPLSPCPK